MPQRSAVWRLDCLLGSANRDGAHPPRSHVVALCLDVDLLEGGGCGLGQRAAYHLSKRFAEPKKAEMGGSEHPRRTRASGGFVWVRDSESPGLRGSPRPWS